jgi:hypothetical protein
MCFIGNPGKKIGFCREISNGMGKFGLRWPLRISGFPIKTKLNEAVAATYGHLLWLGEVAEFMFAGLWRVFSKFEC